MRICLLEVSHNLRPRDRFSFLRSEDLAVTVYEMNPAALSAAEAGEFLWREWIVVRYVVVNSLAGRGARKENCCHRGPISQTGRKQH